MACGLFSLYHHVYSHLVTRLWRHAIFCVSCLPSRPEGRASWLPPFCQTVKSLTKQ